MFMASKPLLLSFFLIIFSSFLHLGFSDSSLDLLLRGIGHGSVAVLRDMQCMQKLLPCQSFLKSPNNPPPQDCCLPLNEMVANGSECLCAFFNNLELLQSMNISREEALKLPAACGAHVDISKCKTEASSPTSPSTGAADTGSADTTTEDST